MITLIFKTNMKTYTCSNYMIFITSYTLRKDKQIFEQLIIGYVSNPQYLVRLFLLLLIISLT